MYFDDKAYNLSIDNGYTFIIIRDKISKQFQHYAKERDMRILKAVRCCENIPDGCICEPIGSDLVKQLLQDDEVDCFIILTDE